MSKLALGAELARMRQAAPLVQNITNYVAMNPMANLMLAIGASPAMVHAQEEAAEFAGFAGALTVNIGTLDPDWVKSMERAAWAANEAGTPWVLDPVAVGATALRRDAGERLLALNPTVIRGNASEIIALAGAGGAGKGVDAGDEVAAAEAAGLALVAQTGGVVAVTGPVDYVMDGRKTARISNGDPVMPLVTALGCSLTGVVGAFLAGGGETFDATVAALAAYTVAGEDAAARSEGPGSFAAAFPDALHRLTPEDLDAKATVEVTAF